MVPVTCKKKKYNNKKSYIKMNTLESEINTPEKLMNECLDLKQRSRIMS